MAKTRGYDAGKKIVGRRRHIAVDTDGRFLMINLTPADRVRCRLLAIPRCARFHPPMLPSFVMPFCEIMWRTSFVHVRACARARSLAKQAKIQRLSSEYRWSFPPFIQRPFGPF
jgi:hypothetical protein